MVNFSLFHCIIIAWKAKRKKLLILVKSLDGGTGTFLFNFLKIKKIFKNQLEIKTVVFEKPKFKKIITEIITFIFIHKKRLLSN